MIHQRKILKAIAYAILLCFTSLTGAQPLYAIPANTQLPTGEIPKFGITADGISRDEVNNVMTINQGDNKTSVIEWGNFSIGADAAVNFVGSDGKTFTGMNSLNYVTGKDAPISEIYGQLTALGGNIFIANPAGVQIGNSAQINVGSLYVTNKDIGEAIKDGELKIDNTTDIASAISSLSVADTNAELMSLGSIISTNNNVTFDGNRIVIDTDRLYSAADTDAKIDINQNPGALTIKTTDANDVILGYTYDGYNEADGYAKAEARTFTVNGGKDTITQYMWVKDLFQLQDMDTNLDGWYALRNSIDASYTANMNQEDGVFLGFNPIGNSTNRFTGRFDGLGYDIFGLRINREGQSMVGLFGSVGNDNSIADRAYVRNFTLNSGNIVGNSTVGAAIGQATDGTVIENIINTADVEGKGINVGGIIGSISGSEKLDHSRTELNNLINVGTVKGKVNVGGIAGYISYAQIGGETYNLGNIIGTGGINDDNNGVGGIVGSAQNSIIGNPITDDGSGFQIYNQSSVTGQYNVGGIVGLLQSTKVTGTDGSKKMGESTVQNVANHGTITAKGNTSEKYYYHTAETTENRTQQKNLGKDDKLGQETQYHDDLAEVDSVNIANVGGIVGNSRNGEHSDDEDQHITISNVLNDGDVRTDTNTESKNDIEYYYYIAGNVGGVVGRADDTAIENVTNRENSVAGAHNVGGIAGLLTGKSSITNGTNDGGGITGTGARLSSGGFAYERVRPLGAGGGSDETFIIGNIGGIAGYMYGGEIIEDKKGNEVITNFIENSTNRGTVHSAYINEGTSSTKVPENAKAANVGGVVGKVDSGVQLSIDKIKPDDPNAPNTENDFKKVSIRHSYNTGEVQGFTGVGGVAGMMYNGAVARSFNTGKITSTRLSDAGTIEPLNMGGIVGDTTENTEARTMLYDVYNAGQIGDSDYNYYGRHVGGVVGRLTGDIYKAYNTGDVYNGFSVTGGVVGWWNDGNIRYVFNTGNVTGFNKNTGDLNVSPEDNKGTGSYVGGIVGGLYIENNKTLEYAYNLGTIRSFSLDTARDNKGNYVSGIIGAIEQDKWNGNSLTINNVYTLGNIYAATGNEEKGFTKDDVDDQNSHLSAVWNGSHWGKEDNPNVDIENVYYITPEDASLFTPLTEKGVGTNFNKAIKFDNRMNAGQDGTENEYQYDENGVHYKMTIATPDTRVDENGYTEDIKEDATNPWRIYNGTPILNVFMPYAEDYFSENALPGGVTDVQYGTAYNPLLTIIRTEGDITLNWDNLKTTGAAGLAVYGGGLTLNGFQANNNYYYGGTIYADGALKITAAEDQNGTFMITDGARLYGSSVEIDTNGNDALISGTIQATGNDGGNGSVTITSGKEKDIEGNVKDSDADIEILGNLISTEAGTDKGVTIPSISGIEYSGWNTKPDGVTDWNDVINEPKDTRLPTYAEMYAHKTDDEVVENGTITVTTAGSASILYGNMGMGAIKSYGDFSVTADKGIHLDSAMNLGGNLNLTSDGEIVLDFASDGSIEHIHDFVDHFNKEKTDYAVNIKGGGNFIIGLDMWNDEKGTFDINKFDKDDSFGSAAELEEGLDAMNVRRLNDEGDVDASFQYHADENVYLWIEDAYQLKGIQDYIADTENNSQEFRDAFLRYNFALKNDIDASVLKDEDGNSTFTSIGTGTDGFYGVFDGRGFRILGLTANGDDAGLFSKLTSKEDNTASSGGDLRRGTVRDLRVYSSNFSGTNSAGAIAGVNEGGVISGVTTLGNHVEAKGGGENAVAEGINGAAGGIVGINTGDVQGNKGVIKSSDASDVVVAGGANVTAGGVAGINAEGGLIGTQANGDGDFEIEKGKTAEDYLVTADSAVTANTGRIFSIGGAVGVNRGEANLLNSTGVTNGRSGTDAYNVDKNVGGVVGLNDGDMTSLYNESIVMGKDNVGGVAGTNEGNMSNAVNATSVTADTTVDEGDNTAGNVGGLAGVNSGTIDSGRNAGVVTGGQNVGGLVGANNSSDEGKTTGILKNLSNALAAVINGKKFVGGIAGSNSGTITGASNLVNEGKISGETYVGGIVGANSGTINGNEGGTDNGVGLTNKATVSGNQFVGGVAGHNAQGGRITNTNSDADLEATGNYAKYFGGVAGQNDGTIDGATNSGELIIGTKNANDEIVSTAEYVGGIVGLNKGDLNGILRNEGTVLGKDKVGGLAGENANDQLLKGEESNRLIVTNTGDVTATDGSAGGIFYYNTGEIKYADLTNTGTVNGKETLDGGHGGLFGINTGTITYSTLTNGGTVEGGNNVGGLIGKNSGAVKYSSLKNEYGAIVSGIGSNVGGLIGYNTGEIIGGRIDDGDKDLGLYTYKIYNNGEVTGATNVGGLIGNNAVEGEKTGSLTAGYNTGVVSVTENSEGKNVGGIVGVNAGIIDQVFNTVMTLDKNGKVVDGAISGKTNVGGIVGSNTGTLTNTYNTTGVSGTTNIGNIAGENSGTVENVYATNDSGALIGSGGATGSYSFSDTDKGKEGITVIARADRNKENSYGAFDFTDEDGDKAVWKIYEGKNGQSASGTPLLKVFLTKAEYTGGTNFTYNGQGQGLSLDGVTVDGEKLSDVAKTLLSALTGKNAYDGYLGFSSEQIAASGEGNSFNPNNLGYDIDATFNIKKAQLSVTLDDISRTYGDANITNNNTATDNGHYLDGNGYGYTVSAANGLTKDMIDKLGGEGFYTFVEDGAVKGVSGQKETNDVKGYTWSATFNLGDLSNNYEFAGDSNNDGTLFVNNGVSNVTKADLHVTLDEARHTYGNTAVTNNGGAYAIKGDEVTFLNGDEWTVGDLVVTKTEDTALTGDEIRVTENAGGDYKWNGTVVGKDGTNIDQNYNIIIDNAEQGATSTVEQAKLTIALDEVQRTYGDTSITNNNGKYTFQFADGTRLVNGDNGLVINTEKIVDNALYYDKNAEETRTQNVKKDDYAWTVDKSDFTGVDDFLTNYDVTVNDGTSIVNQKELTVNDVAASIVYGNQGDRGFKLFDEDGIVSGGLNGIAYGDDVRLNVDFSDISEENLTGEYANNRDGRITANVGTYEDSLIFSGLALTGDSKKIGNYKLASDWAGGKIRVDKANLKITLEDIVREYGTLKPEEGSYGYAAEGLANEDKLTFNDDIAQSLDGALVWKGNELRTNDKGDYSYSDGIEKAFEGFNFGNYGYTIEGGSSEVTPRKISISDIYASIVYGMQDGKGFVIDRGGSLGERAYADDDLNLSYELSLGDGNFDASGVYMTNKDGRKTADVGFYGSEKLTFDGLTLSGEQAGNYELVSNTVNGYITVTPATLYVTLSDVKHTYGDTSLDDDTKYGIDGFSGLVNDDDKNPGYTKDKIFGELSDIDDDALTDDGITKDANPNGESYTWTAKVSTVVDKLSQNYKIEVIDGKSTVGKAKLVVNVNNVDTIYGTQFDKDKYGYVFDENFGLVNNDNEETIRGALGITADDYHNEAEKDGAGGVWTDGYKDDGYEITLNKQVNLTNYEVEYRAGEATVTKADLTIKADDQNMLIGTTPNFTGTTLTELANQLVNGDSLPDGFGYEFGLEDESILDVIGTHPGVIGLLLGGRFYDGGKYEDWGNTVNAVFANYNVNVEPGLLTIVPPSNSNYGHLHSDGWDRLRNFRERKAEVFFHEGGMEYDEDM